MKKRYRIAPFALITIILILWQALSISGFIPHFMLPSPVKVLCAFCKDFPLLMYHLKITLIEAAFGIFVSIAVSFVFAVIMDRFAFIHRAVYPILVITQTIPTIALAPLLILWFGYGMSSKVILIVISCFFPLTISLLTGFASVDKDAENLLRTLGATKLQILKLAKIPSSLPYFFSGLRISASYSIIGAVISEWLGGTQGLGVYMTRVKKSYAYDKLFAVIFLVSALSLVLIKILSLIEKRITKHEKKYS
jgi:ABC-type nitrate/sulfonate/bicarbonate transport system permease component